MVLCNNQEMKFGRFPNGESYLDVGTTVGEICIELKFQSDEDLIHLMMLKKHFDSIGKKSSLMMRYIPYSRMDRAESYESSSGEDKARVFTLKYVCEFINYLGFTKVYVDEPHSDVCVALLDKVEVRNSTSILVKELLKTPYVNCSYMEDDIYVVYPDAGASKRYSKQLKGYKVLEFVKERDFETGALKNFRLISELGSCKFAVIVDDLCSRGGTFMGIAKILKGLGVEKVVLLVTHCENTIYDGDVLENDLIDEIWTTDSIVENRGSSKLNIVKGVVGR